MDISTGGWIGLIFDHRMVEGCMRAATKTAIILLGMEAGQHQKEYQKANGSK